MKSRFLLILAAVVLLSVWVVGCSDDGPAEPEPTQPTTGTVVVNPAPDTLDCTWQLTGPSSYDHNGIGGETLTSLDPGDYTLTWGAVSGWNTPDPASPTLALAAGKTVTFSGTYTVAATEAVSVPDAPSGPAAGVEDQDLSYSASGGASNLGHALEYRFDWGDGSFSDWGTTAVQHSWASDETYNVRAQARCIDHPTVVSDWSAPTVVTITVYVAETISAPVAPTGSASNTVGQTSAYSSSGAVSSYDDDLQYRFDWGDGSFSTWSVSTSASHSWAAEGSFDVRAQARCADHVAVESDWSPVTAVTITAAPVEMVSTPDAPGGPVSGETNVSLIYTASGAVNSFSHLVEYRFDFDDGYVSPWMATLTSLSHSWATAGSYDVIVQARCRTHPAIESEWSAPTTVVISVPAEIIASPPGAINGIADGIINEPYEYAAYHSSMTNLGHSVEGRFEWGDGTYSDWIATAPYEATHTWPTEGTYTVKYEARCSLHTDISYSADSLVVTITTTAVETISKPGYVNYSYDLRNPEINIERNYTAFGGTNSLGHDQEVLIDWGDGTQSGWVPNFSLVAKTWTSVGTYPMTRQARCAAHPEVVSEWSDPIYINPRAPETVSTPDAPPGPTVGYRNENMYYTGTGSESSWHTGWIEYRFDWGDGTAITAWATDTTLVHRFTTFGEYEVKTQARCVYPGHGEPESEWSPPTTVSIVEKVTIYQYGPRGPYYAAVDESNTFEAYHEAFSDAGHTTFEYQFDWGDGTFSEWSSSMSADHAFTAAGTYDVYYRARCAADTDAVSDWSTQYKRVEVTDAPEAVSTPDIPTVYPPTAVVVGQDIQIGTSNCFSNHGHPVEFQFDYGDGTVSEWTAGTPSSSFYQLTLYHTYTSVGSFEITVKARCATHPAVESAVSGIRPIDVYEEITEPATPTGPATGTLGANLTFTTTGSTSSEGHALEYSFEYRRGSYTVVYTSDWSASLSDDHVFTDARSDYSVRVRARCATDTSAVSSFSSLFYFTVTE
jgi:hypothetical protein